MLLAGPIGPIGQLAGFWHMASQALSAPSGSGLMTLAVLALTSMIIAFLAHGSRIAAAVTAGPLTGLGVALRVKSWSAAFQRQLNPGAPGRARPRAPSAAPAVA